MVVRGRKRLIRCLRKEGTGDDGEVWKENMIPTEVKRELFDRVAIPTVVYGSKIWSLSAQDRRKIEVFEMMSFRNVA